MDARQYIRSALTAARTLAPRQVRLSQDGVTVVDALGGKHVLRTDAASPDGKALAEGLWPSGGFYRREGLPKVAELSGHGAWTCSENDGEIVLKAKRQRGPCLEAVASVDPEQMNLVRRLYAADGVDVIVAVEGEARARDVALALASEISLAGHGTALDIAPEDGWRLPAEERSRAGQEGPALFGVPQNPRWSVQLLPQRSHLGSAAPVGKDVCRVVVFQDDRTSWSFARSTPEGLRSQTRPTALIAVSLEKSSAKARIVLSEAASALAAGMPDHPEGPWTTFNARKAKSAAVPRAPKTWHQTTEAVAEAFLERRAPRGYVSGQSLFFHGPVAFSIYYNNPVAAIVDAPDGPVIFMGRSSQRGGTKAGTISMAQGDVRKAAEAAGVPVLHVDRLPDFLTLDGMSLEEIARRFERSKDEASFSPTCTVDTGKLADYLESRKGAAEAELERSDKRRSPTYVKAGAWHGLKSVAELRDTLVERFGFDLPDMGDSQFFEERRAEAHAQADELQRKRREAGRQAASASASMIETEQGEDESFSTGPGL